METIINNIRIAKTFVLNLGQQYDHNKQWFRITDIENQELKQYIKINTPSQEQPVFFAT